MKDMIPNSAIHTFTRIYILGCELNIQIRKIARDQLHPKMRSSPRTGGCRLRPVTERKPAPDHRIMSAGALSRAGRGKKETAQQKVEREAAERGEMVKGYAWQEMFADGKQPDTFVEGLSNYDWEGKKWKGVRHRPTRLRLCPVTALVPSESISDG